MRLTQVSVSLVALAALLVVCLTPYVRAQSPASPPGGYLPIDGVKLYYEDCNSGASINVVLIHDGLLDSVTWDGIWTPLCAKYHALRYDRRSYGRSDAATAPYAPTNDLLAMMRQAKMDRAILVGNSSGAGLALDFALVHPEMTEGLFLIGPVVHGMPTTPFTLQRGNTANAPLAKSDAKAAAENWSRDPFLISGADPEARRKLLEALMASPQNLKTGGQFEMQLVPPTVTRLSQIQAPALVLVGAADIPDVMIYSGAIEAALPIVFLELWKDTGHMIQLQQPTQLVERFRRFARLADRRETSVQSGALRDYVGSYKFFNRTIGLSLKGNRLEITLPDYPAKPLFAASPSRFFVRTTETEFEFDRDASGKIQKLIIHSADGNNIDCPRVETAGNSQPQGSLLKAPGVARKASLPVLE